MNHSKAMTRGVSITRVLPIPLESDLDPSLVKFPPLFERWASFLCKVWAISPADICVQCRQCSPALYAV